MWIYNQANKSLKREKNISLFYCIACTITTLIMFTAINICNNEMLINSSEVTLVDRYYILAGTPLEIIKKTNLLILLLMAVLFTVVCSFNYLRKKSKELAYLTLNGATMVDAIRYLLYQNGVILLISSVAGITLGIITMPLFNAIVYTINGEWGPLITFKLDSISLTLGFIAVECMALVILNCGYLIRKEVKDLIDEEDTAIEKDKRLIRLPKTLFLICYLIPLVFAIFGYGMKDSEQLMGALIYLGVAGTYGVVRYVIPKTLERLKKKKYMYDFKKLVYLSNGADIIRKSIAFIFALQIAAMLFLTSFCEYKVYTGMKENLMFCLVGVSILISMTLIYTIFIEIINNKDFLKQMKAFGYTNEEVLDVVKNVVRTFFILGVMVAILQLLALIFVYYATGIMSLAMALGAVGSLLVPLGGMSLVGEILCKKIIKKNLDGGF